MPDAAPVRRIPSKKRGNRLGFWFFRTAVRLHGLRGAYALLRVVAFWYWLFDRDGVAAGANYIRRRFPELRGLRLRWRVYRLFLSQGRSLIDRGYAISGAGRFDMRITGYEQIEAWARDPSQGFVLLTAHVGNWQIAMTALDLMKKPVALVMRPEDNPSVLENLALSAERGPVRIVSPEQFLGGVLEVLKLLKEGYIVGFMGDRAYDFPAVEVRFLGDTARFPYGAFQIAAAAECPLVVLLSAKREGLRYDVEVAKVMHPRWQPGVDKRAQLQRWVQEYADVLEDFSRRYPLQCFLYHDVWAKSGETRR